MINKLPPPEPRFCKVCSIELKMVRGESRARYAKKQYCSSAHARDNFKATGRAWWGPFAMRQRQFSEGGETYEH